ncbi:MAG TPA: SDR family NAD(P)-dependent oxidoreductase [Thermoleophilaceae bacterium]|nr:SDR family NAD(P)-dependent oxidoreductase [Thermoleophilaceae bacterium]
MARVFLTGGSGFIGGALIPHLHEQGHEVVGLARSDTAARTLRERDAEVVRGNVLDEASMAAGMQGCELAYHVAGLNSHCPKDPELMMRVNVDGPQNAVRAAAAAGVGRVVFTSSAATLGEVEGTVGTEGSAHRGSYLSVYDQSKHEGEQAAFAAAAYEEVELVAVNPSSVQGPGRTHGTGAIAIAYLNGKLPAFLDVPVSIVDIDDCVEGHLLAAEHGAAGQRYLLNGATIPSTRALEIVSEVAGVEHKVRMIPPPVARAVAAASDGVYRLKEGTSPLCAARVRTLLHGHQYDASRSERELGLTYMPVERTFERIVQWAAAEGLVEQPLAVAG